MLSCCLHMFCLCIFRDMHVVYIYIYILFSVILRAVARGMLDVTRMIGGFFPVLFSTNSQTFLVSPSLSLFVSFVSSSLLFASVPWRILCCVVFCAVLLCVAVCRCVVCVCVSACVVCHVSGVEQCVQVKRQNGGLGNVLFLTYSQTENG